MKSDLGDSDRISPRAGPPMEIHISMRLPKAWDVELGAELGATSAGFGAA